MEYVEKRTEFQDREDAGRYIEQLRVAAHDILLDAMGTLAIRQTQIADLRLDVAHWMRRDILSGELPNIAEHGIRAPGLSRIIYLLDELSPILRDQVTVTIGNGVPWVVMPRLGSNLRKNLLLDGRLIRLTSAFHPGPPLLLNHETHWGVVAEGMHRAVYEPKTSTVPPPFRPTPPTSPGGIPMARAAGF